MREFWTGWKIFALWVTLDVWFWYLIYTAGRDAYLTFTS